MGAWIYRTNSTLSLDPDWGKRTPTPGSVLKVKVVPVNPKATKWEFYILLPNIDAEDKPIDDEEEEDSTVEIGSYLCEVILEEGDQYELSEILEEDASSFVASIPVLCFNPLDADEFIWLSPPPNCKH